MNTLGPRYINYTLSNGHRGVIKITVTFTGEIANDLGKGEQSRHLTGTVRIESSMFNRLIKAIGDDELHLVMTLMWFSDIWLRKTCQERNIKIYKWKPGDIGDDFSVFKP